jgi:hypothetical protein
MRALWFGLCILIAFFAGSHAACSEVIAGTHIPELGCSGFIESVHIRYAPVDIDGGETVLQNNLLLSVCASDFDGYCPHCQGQLCLFLFGIHPVVL